MSLMLPLYLFFFYFHPTMADGFSNCPLQIIGNFQYRKCFNWFKENIPYSDIGWRFQLH